MRPFRFLFLLLSFTALFWSCKSDDPAPEFYDMVIENVRLFDGFDVTESAMIFVQDGIVTRIAANSTADFKTDNLVDGTGKTLIPGLIEAHAHIQDVSGLEEAIKHGVLTVINPTYDSVEQVQVLRQAGLARDDIPYFLSGGITLNVDGGFISGDTGPTISDVSEIPQYIEDRVGEGSDFIKMMIDEGGNGNLPTLTDTMMQVCTDEAHGHQLKCYAHITTMAHALQVAEAGADGLFHIWWREQGSSSDQQLQELANSGMFVIPTAMWVYRRNLNGQSAMSNETLAQELMDLYSMGIPIIAGSDDFLPGRYPDADYGEALIDELQIYADAGIPPIDVLRTATGNPSEHMELSPKGRIMEGAPADFVLVQGNPLQDFDALRDVLTVWKRGQRVP